jgi:condensin-2 complex subunit G2
VRASFCNLLLRVKPVRTVQFYNVVPVNHLLQRLALDRGTRAIALPLTELLVESYFPPQKDGTKKARVWIDRCVVFVRHNVDAAVAFYSNLEACVSLASVAKFICLLHRFE